MNKMKKLLALALACAMALSMLAGCSSKEEPASESGTEVESTPYVPSITYEEVDLSTLTEPVEFVTGMAPDTVVGTVGGYDITVDFQYQEY